mgnify:CR=1 FL=1|jgi:ribosomal protein S21
MAQVKRRERETTSSVIRRFVRAVQQSGILLRAKRSRFYEKKKTRREMRDKALHREKVVTEQDKLRKLGLLDEELQGRNRRRY